MTKWGLTPGELGELKVRSDNVSSFKQKKYPKYKVVFPNNTLELGDWYDKAVRESLPNLKIRTGKKNTSFVGIKEDIDQYFYNWGSVLEPSDYKRIKSKRGK